MGNRIAKVNKEIQRVVGRIMQEEADLPREVLVTVTRAETTKNLRATRVWLSIFPKEQAWEVFSQLKKQMYALQGSFNRAITLQPLPRIIFMEDQEAADAERIERKIKELKK
jgi:ribosome-binding factor A